MLGLPPQTWHPFRLTAQHATVKAEVKAADTISTPSKLHQWQWHPRIFEVWNEMNMTLRYYNTCKNLWKPDENLQITSPGATCVLKPSPFFPGQRSHGAIATAVTAVTSNPLVGRSLWFLWIHGVDAAISKLRMVYDVLNRSIKVYIKLNLNMQIYKNL